MYAILNFKLFLFKTQIMSNSIFQQLDFNDFAKDCKEIDIDFFDKGKYGIIKAYENAGEPVLFIKEIDVFNQVSLKEIAEIQHLCWNFQKVLFLYVYTKTEVRIYNCSKKPFSLEENITEVKLKKELKKLELYSCKETDKSKLETLNNLFSRIAIDTGFIWSSPEANDIKKQLNLETRVDKYLIQSLIKVARALDTNGLNNKLIIHKLIMRSLFLFYLEDKKATSIDLYESFLHGAASYFDILESPEATYNLFEKLADDFNGSLFNFEENEKDSVTKEHLSLIKKCFFDGNIDEYQQRLFSWKLFDFSIIRIELLSEIYENFLSELDNKEKKNTGTFYTPPSLVELILNEKLSTKNGETNYNIKTLDPSCGSGIFLVQSFKRLVKRYENKHKSKLNDFNVLIDILKSNIFGIEIDSKSIKVAAFSLYLALLDNLDPKTGWWNGFIKFPYLVNDPEDKTLKEQGNNLFTRDTISDLSAIKELQNFDLIVGNPPFGTKNLSTTIKTYCEANDFAKEMVLPFMHKATLLAPKGKIALIFNTKVLTNTGGTYQNFRQWLFNENYVEKIYNFSILRKAPKNSGGQLFGSAVGPISIVFYKKEKPEKPKDSITYYAPKTYIKNDVLEGIVIDSSDEKFLPRIECEKKDTKIWKIAMWGSYFDFELIEDLEKKYKKTSFFFKENQIGFGVGLELSSPKNKFDDSIKMIPHHNSKTIGRYCSPIENSIKIEGDYFRRLGNKKAYKSPHIFLNEGIQKNNITSSYIDYDSSFYKGIVGIYSQKSDEELLKLISLFFNSIYAKYYAFLSTSSWGIERDVIKHRELFDIPFILKELSSEIKEELILIFDKLSITIFENERENFESQINALIFKILSIEEQIIIQDTLEYGLDLFEKQEKSKAVLPINQIDIYTNRLSKELNHWLDDVDLKVSATIYDIDRNCPLYMVKISFGNEQKPVFESKENIYKELKRLDQNLWKEEASSLYFRKKLNYFDDDDVYIIKPNQRRFWSQTAAMEDSKSLLVEILNMKE
jgi:type I restriction-modification system DNA methylase subunit